MVSAEPDEVYRYVPDMYTLLNAADRFYGIVEQRNLLKNRENMCPFGNLLYNAFCHMAIVMRCLSATSVNRPDILQAERMFETVGFYKCSLHPYSKEWADGIGEFYDEERLERFNLTMDKHENSTLEDGYWNEKTAEHLPNFKLVIKLIVEFQSSMRYCKESIYDHAFNGIGKDNAFRTRMRKFTPGLAHFNPIHLSDQLYSIALEVSKQDWKDSPPLFKYLQLDEKLLSFLVPTYSGFYSEISGSFVIGDIDVQGNSLIVSPVKETVLKSNEKALPNRAHAACVVMKTTTHKEKAKYARAFPLVRIVAPHNLIYSYAPSRKHSDWYYSKYAVTTPEFNLDSVLNLIRGWKRS